MAKRKRDPHAMGAADLFAMVVGYMVLLMAATLALVWAVDWVQGVPHEALGTVGDFLTWLGGRGR